MIFFSEGIMENIPAKTAGISEDQFSTVSKSIL